MTQLPACSRFFTHVAVTMALADPASDLLVRRLSLLRDCVALARRRSGVEIDTAAVLPAEMHLLCRLLPGEEPDPALRVIRAGFARHAGQDGPVWDSAFSIAEVPAAALGARRRFLLAAPVRAGLARAPGDWPYSSLRRHGRPQGDAGPAWGARVRTTDPVPSGRGPATAGNATRTASNCATGRCRCRRCCRGCA